MLRKIQQCNDNIRDGLILFLEELKKNIDFRLNKSEMANLNFDERKLLIAKNKKIKEDYLEVIEKARIALLNLDTSKDVTEFFDDIVRLLQKYDDELGSYALETEYKIQPLDLFRQRAKGGYSDMKMLKSSINYYIKQPENLTDPDKMNSQVGPYPAQFFIILLRNYNCPMFKKLMELWEGVQLFLSNAVKYNDTKVLNIKCDKNSRHTYSLPKDLEEKINALTIFSMLRIREYYEIIRGAINREDTLLQEDEVCLLDPEYLELCKSLPETFECVTTGMQLVSSNSFFSSPASKDKVKQLPSEKDTRQLALY